MPSDVVPTLFSICGAVAAGFSGLGGLIKFRTWWRDRELNARIESAQALMEKGSADWQQSMGQRMFARAHFARLTGLDVPDGHLGLIALHERLGGADADLNLMRRAVDRLDRSAPCALPRDMARRDWVVAFGAAFFCLFFAVLACVLVGALAITMDRLNWKQDVPLATLMVLVVGGLYAAVSALFSGALFKEVDRYVAAHHIRQALSQGKCGMH